MSTAVDSPDHVENRRSLMRDLRVAAQRVARLLPLLCICGMNLHANPLPRKRVIALAIAQSGAMLYDGFTTKRFEKYLVVGADGVPYTYHEADPISRLVLGPEPTWTRMVPIGGATVVGAAALGAWIGRRRGWTRHLWWTPQAGIIALSIVEGSENLGASRADLMATCTRNGDCYPLEAASPLRVRP